MRDWTIAGIASLAVVIVLLRLLLAAADIGTWTLAWRVVALPTNPFIAAMTQIDELKRTPIGRLNIAELILALIIGVAALTSLSSVALRRPD